MELAEIEDRWGVEMEGEGGGTVRSSTVVGNKKGRTGLGEDHKFSFGSEALSLKCLRDNQVEM